MTDEMEATFKALSEDRTLTQASSLTQDCISTEDTLYINGVDKKPIFAHHWYNKKTPAPKAVIQIVHGITEHSGRYKRFASQLVAQGFSVVANDHRGHGHTVTKHDKFGHYADKNGWQLVTSDQKQINDWIKETYPATPIFIMGHSMGSFITRQFIINHGESVKGCILSGSTWESPLTYKAGGIVAWIESKRIGPKNISSLMNFLSLGSFNRAFKPARTRFDWLSRDVEEVDKYAGDELCGFDCTTQLWMDLLSGLADISSTNAMQKIPNELPILLVSGASDPVGKNGKGVNALERELIAAGNTNIECSLFPDARHELLNEINRDEVSERLISWLNQQL